MSNEINETVHPKVDTVMDKDVVPSSATAHAYK